MAHASSDLARPGRRQTLAVGGLLLAGLFCLIQLGQAQTSNKDKATPKDKAVKAPAAPAFKPAGTTTLNLTIASEGGDVPEMVKIINTRVEEA